MNTRMAISFPRLRGFGGRARLFFHILFKRVYVEDALDQAAALSYHTLFSLLPIMVIVVLVLSILSKGEKGGIDQQVQHFIFQQFRLDALTMVDESGQNVNIPAVISSRIAQVREAVQNPITGIVGFAILLYGAIKIMLVIEAAFNRIYGSPAPRSWSRRITLYWCVLTLGPLLVAASLAATNAFFKYASSFAYAQAVLVPLSFLAGFFVSWALMIVLYKVVPGTHVNWSSALLGGLVAAVLWELGKNLFGLYVRKSVGTSWYGALALLPLFMFWIYWTWAFILVGLHVSYIHQYFTVLARRHVFMQTCNTSITDLRWVLPLGVMLVRCFRAGKPTLAHEAADALNLPTEVTTDFLRGLQNAGIVHVVESPGSGGMAYSLARPPEAITAYELINAAKALCTLPAETVNIEHSPGEAAHTPALDDLEEKEAGWTRAHSLADLAAEPVAAEPVAAETKEPSRG